MMASALDSVEDKKRVRTEIHENYTFLLVAFADKLHHKITYGFSSTHQVRTSVNNTGSI